jgi:chromosome segregation ATPase
MQTMKKKEREDLKTELAVAKRQLEEDEARFNGGYSPTLQRDYLSLNEEIEVISDELKMLEIRSVDSDWEKNNVVIEILKKRAKQDIPTFQAKLQRLEKQREDINARRPSLLENIKKIEDKLNLKKERNEIAG